MRRRHLLLGLLVVGCAASPAPAAVPRAARPAPPAPVPVPDAAAPDAAPVSPATPVVRAAEPDATMETKHLTEQQWLAKVREQLSKQLKVEPAELRFSPDRQWVVVVRGPPPPPEGKPVKHPRRYRIVVTDAAGKRSMKFRPVVAKGSDEPPRDVHFLADNRLVYEVVEAPPAPPPLQSAGKARKKPTGARRPAKLAPAPRATAAKPAAPDPRPTRLFIIQPLTRRGRPIRCQGEGFTFTGQQDHLAFVGGEPDAAFVAVDGTQVYPRKGRAVIGGEPAWSKDGRSLAFLELRPRTSARLVLLAEYDNPSGDTTWDLPMSAGLEGAKVFWAGAGKLVVGKTSLRPIFAATFFKEKAPPPWREP